MVMCAYGNCENEVPSERGFKLTITESWAGRVSDRQSFCCREHGWEWLKEHERKLTPTNPKPAKQL